MVYDPDGGKDTNGYASREKKTAVVRQMYITFSIYLSHNLIPPLHVVLWEK
jgi:hypothetical protein